MMRKVVLRAPHVCTRPSSAGPLQAFNVPKGRSAGRFPPRRRAATGSRNLHTSMRHRRAPSREAAPQKLRGKRPFLEQRALRLKLPMKRASTSGNFRKVARPCLATFGMAQPLVTNTVPWWVQTASCPRIGLKLISFSALCILMRAVDMGIPVTTSERVGRTMEAKALRLWSNRNAE